MPLSWPRGRPRLPGPLIPPARVERRRSRVLAAASRRRAAFRRVRPTAEGWVFLATAMAVALAALNTGNNLLYLVLAAMLALVVTSGVLSESSLRGLEVDRRFDERIFAGQPTHGTWLLRNNRRWLPNLAIDVEELPGRHARLLQCQRTTVPYLAGGAEERRRGTWVFACRGIHRLERVRVSTTWPFGILRKWYEVPLVAEVVVYPQPSVDPGPVARRSLGSSGAEANRRSRNGTGDLRELRDHRAGEDLRLVHWRTSARLRKRVAVERDAEEDGRLTVRVETPGEGTPLERATRFELTVSQATCAVLSAGRAGVEVVLRVPGLALPPARDRVQRDRLLRRLALLELDG